MLLLFGSQSGPWQYCVEAAYHPFGAGHDLPLFQKTCLREKTPKF